MIGERTIRTWTTQRRFVCVVFVVVLCALRIGYAGSVENRNGTSKYNSIRIQVPQRQAKQSLPFGNCVLVLGRTCPDPDVTFFLFTDLYFNEPQKIHIGDDLASSNLTNSIFDPNRPTKIIIHGYNSDRFLGPLVEIKNQFLQYDRYMNVFMVDWSPLGQGPCYPAAVWNTRHAGKCSAQLVQRIRDTGATDIQVIGFSLGAHVSAFLANNLRPYKLPRISGLDPAMPGFVGVTADNKLDKTDAEFVDVLHTNALVQGQVEECGHVDFYMNGGVSQPGCWAEASKDVDRDASQVVDLQIDTAALGVLEGLSEDERKLGGFWACNHHRAPQYFAESITTDRGYWGWPCSSFLAYLFGGCPPKEPQIICGQWVSEESRGMHLVLTDSVYPFAVGKYTGPAIEVAFRNSERNRLKDYELYKREVCGGDRCQHKDSQAPLGVQMIEELEGVPVKLGDIFSVQEQSQNVPLRENDALTGNIGDYLFEGLGEDDDDGFSVVMV